MVSYARIDHTPHFERRLPWPCPPYLDRRSTELSKNVCNPSAGAQRASMKVSHMIFPRWQNPCVYATSADQYAAFAQRCSLKIRGLRINFAVSARIRVKLVRSSAENTITSKPCENAPRRACVARRRAGKSPNLVQFERLPRTQSTRTRRIAECEREPGFLALLTLRGSLRVIRVVYCSKSFAEYFLGNDNLLLAR
jgi:hypothetical protein